MTPQQIVGLGIRLAAIWLAVGNVGQLISWSVALTQMNSGDKIRGAYLVSGWWLAVAVLLWFFPMWTAHKLIPRTRFENKLNVEPMELARAGCALLGLWICLAHMQTFLWFFFWGVFARGDASALHGLTPEERLRFLVSGVEIGIGLLLIFAAARFAELAFRGTPMASDRGEDPK
jgi:hypothetical protein